MKTFAELNAEHETLRSQIIAKEGGIDPFKSYPELDALAMAMFNIASNGTGKVVIPLEVILKS